MSNDWITQMGDLNKRMTSREIKKYAQESISKYEDLFWSKIKKEKENNLIITTTKIKQLERSVLFILLHNFV